MLGGSIVLPGVALRTKLQYIARFQLQQVQSVWCQLWDVMNTFWWVIPTARECFVTNVCAQKVSRSHCVRYCSLDCSREKMCVFFFFLSVHLICSQPYWCQYMHMFVHIFHFFNSSTNYLHAFLPAVWLTKNPCKVWYCWKIKTKSISRSLFVLFMM